MKIFLVAGEPSGDLLGADLMDAIRRARGPEVRFEGVGGPAMTARGLVSLFPLSDIALVGLVPVLLRLPTLAARISTAARAAVAARPDAMVLIDSPDFTHRVGKRVRRARPDLPILDYVCPQVWAWRTGRAKAMRAYVDRVLAVLPFEPEAMRRLDGPPCVYVGHPLVERMTGSAGPGAAVPDVRPTALLLPGSRRSEIDRHLDIFGDAAARIGDAFGDIDWVLPAVAHVEDLIRTKIAAWSWRPRIVLGEQAKWEAFRSARVALAASGTVTLELALAGVPMVVGYRASPLEAPLRRLIKVPSIVLANLVLGGRPIPELVLDACTPEALAREALALLRDGRPRDDQLTALARTPQIMRLPGGERPSEAAAREVLAAADGARPRPAAST